MSVEQLVNEQDRAKLTTLAVEFDSVLQRLPKLRAEMNVFLATKQTLDYVGLVQRLEPQLEAAAEFLDAVDFLPNAMRQNEQVQEFIRRAKTRIVFRTVARAKQHLQDVCTEVDKQKEQQESNKKAQIVGQKTQQVTEQKAKQKSEKVMQREAVGHDSEWSGKTGKDQYGQYGDLVLQQVQQRFRFIPAGSFMMGSSESEPQRLATETQHHVTFKQGFWLADTACTQQLWQAVMGSNPAHFTDNPNNPVEEVSWNDVQLFLRQANDLVSNRVLRLPSEAEWEYACRAGSVSAFSFGHRITASQANYGADVVYEGGGSRGEYRGKTMVVKSFSPNAWGLYQMHGNVWEWCQDRWDDYDNTPTDGSVAQSSNSDRHVLRGGSWNSLPYWLRSAYRRRRTPSYRVNDFGFRLVCGFL